jgi:hypothetical protein
MSHGGKAPKLARELQLASLREEETWRRVDAMSPLASSPDLAPRNPSDLAAFRAAHERAVRLRVLLARHRGAPVSVLQALVPDASRVKH